MRMKSAMSRSVARLPAAGHDADVSNPHRGSLAPPYDHDDGLGASLHGALMGALADDAPDSPRVPPLHGSDRAVPLPDLPFRCRES